MAPIQDEQVLRLALPKGRIQKGVFQLLEDAGVRITQGARAYRPNVRLEAVEAKILKPQGVVQMLASGSRDIGFTGEDWVRELDADLVPVLDTGMDPVRLVLASPAESPWPMQQARPRCATEYVGITTKWAQESGTDIEILRSYGATEVHPPEDAECIVDNTATGATLEANGLTIRATILRSSTRLYANRAAWEDPWKRARIDDLVTMLSAVLEARRRVMLELNVSSADLEEIVAALPAMREPTIAPLHGDAGYAVRAAIPRDELATLIPDLKRRGGSDIVISPFSQIVS